MTTENQARHRRAIDALNAELDTADAWTPSPQRNLSHAWMLEQLRRIDTRRRIRDRKGDP